MMIQIRSAYFGHARLTRAHNLHQYSFPTMIETALFPSIKLFQWTLQCNKVESWNHDGHAWRHIASFHHYSTPVVRTFLNSRKGLSQEYALEIHCEPRSRF